MTRVRAPGTRVREAKGTCCEEKKATHNTALSLPLCSDVLRWPRRLFCLAFCRFIDDLFHISRELMVIIVLGLIQSGT